MDSAKKLSEQQQLQVFRRLYKAFPSGEVEHSEAPDFLVRTPSAVIGIELTDLYREEGPHSRQEQESLREQIKERVLKKWTDAQATPVHVSIHFNPIYEIGKRDVERLVTNIFEIVKQNIPERNGIVDVSYHWVNRDWFPQEIHSVLILRTEDATGSSFTVPDADYIPKLRSDDVRSCIDEKSKRYPDYRRNCDIMWLVIGINIAIPRLSTTFEVPDVTRQFTYGAPFDKVFLLKHDDPALIELTISSEGAS